DNRCVRNFFSVLCQESFDYLLSQQRSAGFHKKNITYLVDITTVIEYSRCFNQTSAQHYSTTSLEHQYSLFAEGSANQFLDGFLLLLFSAVLRHFRATDTLDIVAATSIDPTAEEI
ncbi:MAG: hypothetical protein ACXW04_11230, partial [Methylobacter sp.]